MSGVTFALAISPLGSKREHGRLEERLELTESTTRAGCDRLVVELEAERAERQQLAEQRRGFWSRLFGG